MDRKRFMTVFAVALIGMTGSAIAGPFRDRVEMAHRRIERGIRSGALTREEAHRLRREFDQVLRDEERARADGHLDRRERERLGRELSRLERHISRLKNNDVTR
jgi:hypothetical protein